MKGDREKPLGLDMPFDEALTRFIGTAPAELQDDVRAKKKRPPKRPQGVDDTAPKEPTKPLD
jgi:hypothetical protein